MEHLIDDIRSCRLCAGQFAATRTAHTPKPVVWFQRPARVLIVGQAPGARVHASQRPFTDRSGDRLRDWMGVGETVFYDVSRISILPMAFCFPGYDAKGADLPPPPLCRRTWHARVRAALGPVPLTLAVGGYAQSWLLAGKVSVTDAVRCWRAAGPGLFPLPHPSWRNTGWLRRNPWFETDVLPALRAAVRQALQP